MKQHFQKPAEPVAPVVQLSLEEEAIAIGEIAEISSDADLSLAEVDRAIDVAAGVEDVQTIVDTLETVSGTEEQLIASVAEMAVSGTDADPAELLPLQAVENAMALEGFSETLKNVWNSIVAMLKKAWDQIKSFFESIFDYVQNMKTRVGEVRSRAKSLKELDSSKEFKSFAVNDPKFLVVGLFDNGHNDLVDRIEKNGNYINTAFSEIPRAVSKIGVELVSVLNGFTGDNVQYWEDQAGQAFGKSVNELSRAVTGKVLHAYTGDVLAYSEQYLGYWSIVAVGDKNLNELRSGAKIAALAKVRFKTKSSGMESRKEVRISAPPSLSEINGSLDALEKMIDKILTMRTGEGAKLLKEGVDAIKRAGEAASAKIKGDDKEAQQALKRVMNLAPAYGNWINSPLKDIAHRSAMFIHLMLDLNGKMLNYYK